MANPMRATDDGHDDDLIAYLDGELDEDAAAMVEAELARNPRAREKAEAYRKTYELLDYLPKPEPDPSFTTRTLTRLQPVIDGSAATASGSQPIALSASMLGATTRRRVWPELLAWVAGVLVALGIGYLTHLTTRPATQREPEPTAAEIAMIESLPLYVGVDDLDFLKKLDDSELFDDRFHYDDPQVGNQRIDLNKPLDQPTDANRKKLIELFISYPPARQQQIRTLHNQLAVAEPAIRQSLTGTLLRYSLWLDRLPESDRKEILSASTSHARLDAIEQVHERHWRASLTPAQQEKLKKTTIIEERQDLAQEFRERQRAARAEWILAQRQWQQMTGLDHKPWPFSDDALTQQIEGYLKTALGVDMAKLMKKELQPASCRLTSEEIRDLRSSYEAATKEGYWFSYGACLLRLADRHPALPRPSREAIVRFAQVPDDWKRFIPKEAKKGRLEGNSGRWPDFALELHRAPLKADNRLSPLGPTKPGEFDEGFEKFMKDKLLPALSDDQKKRLTQAEGKWPAYSQEALALAREKNLSVPGITLPGAPKEWDRYYRLQAVKK